MISEPVQYQGKAGFIKLHFQNGISLNTAKCKLGWFSLRQSRMEGSTMIDYKKVKFSDCSFSTVICLTRVP